jgi:hypothetical protein
MEIFTNFVWRFLKLDDRARNVYSIHLQVPLKLSRLLTMGELYELKRHRMSGGEGSERRDSLAYEQSTTRRRKALSMMATRGAFPTVNKSNEWRNSQSQTTLFSLAYTLRALPCQGVCNIEWN